MLPSTVPPRRRVFSEGLTKMRAYGFLKDLFELIYQRSSLTLSLSFITVLMAGLLLAGSQRLALKVHAEDGIAPLATTFTVNSTSDPGGAFASCTTRGGECTLRAAINTANSTP
ncbi:MAG TPA: hypothetical protein VKD91_15900, partial [Pyrinomonadaceae bacterium]|nr:hypothetical protein [Pyrinomonadaceae bacterium]